MCVNVCANDHSKWAMPEMGKQQQKKQQHEHLQLLNANKDTSRKYNKKET